jgi:hypothetical protein
MELWGNSAMGCPLFFFFEMAHTTQKGVGYAIQD